MKKLKVLLASTFLVLSSMLVAVPSGASADGRCITNGIEFWENANKGGKHITFCGNISIANLNNYKVDPSCSLFCATWGNEISSAETFNDSLGHYTLFTRENYNAGCPLCRKLVTNGNTYIPYMGAFWHGDCCNDNIKSFYSHN